MLTLIVLIFTFTLGILLFSKKRNSGLKAFKIPPKKSPGKLAKNEHRQKLKTLRPGSFMNELLSHQPA